MTDKKLDCESSNSLKKTPFWALFLTKMSHKSNNITLKNAKIPSVGRLN